MNRRMDVASDSGKLSRATCNSCGPPISCLMPLDECARSVVEDMGKPNAEVAEEHALFGESRKAHGRAM